jgi:predicted transcriptional regulator/transcriptional regulator with XRE-family HTH domain
MSKTFMGVRLRKLRAERGMTQVALAQALGLSPSYLNQMEQNQRPLTVAVLLKISRTLGVDVQQFSEDEEARLVASMRDALADNPGGETVALPELREVASQMPAVARALLALHRRHQEAMERLEIMGAELGDGRGDFSRTRPMPFEVVRDFFFSHQNHFEPLDTAAEKLAAEARGHGGPLSEWLLQRLMKQHGVRVVPTDDDAVDSQRRYDPTSRVLRLSGSLEPGQQAFQLATQLALLEQTALIESLVESASFGDVPAHALARIGLANYFAGAMLLPYGLFLNAARNAALRHRPAGAPLRRGLRDHLPPPEHAAAAGRAGRALLLHSRGPGGQHLEAAVGHALSLFQDRRHLPAVERVRGLCAARARPAAARAHARRAHLPVGARTVSHGQRGFASPSKTFSIGLGCDIRHASRLIYAKGLDLADQEVPTPIGMGCKVCERVACPQRAFPFIGRPLDVNENESRFTPYAVADA